MSRNYGDSMTTDIRLEIDFEKVKELVSKYEQIKKSGEFKK